MKIGEQRRLQSSRIARVFPIRKRAVTKLAWIRLTSDFAGLSIASIRKTVTPRLPTGFELGIPRSLNW
jgi:hypothetical protein